MDKQQLLCILSFHGSERFKYSNADPESKKSHNKYFPVVPGFLLLRTGSGSKPQVFFFIKKRKRNPAASYVQEINVQEKKTHGDVKAKSQIDREGNVNRKVWNREFSLHNNFVNFLELQSNES